MSDNGSFDRHKNVANPDRHLFEFKIAGKLYGIPDPDLDFGRETFDARNLRIGALVERGVTAFVYAHDFGDDWRCAIKIEAVSETDPTQEYPRFIDGKRRAPPEDVSEEPGFQMFLEAMVDPRHPEHGERRRWHGADFDPEDLSVDLIRQGVAQMARLHEEEAEFAEEFRMEQEAVFENGEKMWRFNFTGLTFLAYVEELKAKIRAQEPPVVHECFQISPDHGYIDIVVDAPLLDRATIEQAILRFRALGEKDWTSPDPIPLDRLRGEGGQAAS